MTDGEVLSDVADEPLSKGVVRMWQWRRLVFGRSSAGFVVRLLLLLAILSAVPIARARAAQAATAWTIFLPFLANGGSPPVSQVMPPTNWSYYITTTDPNVAYSLGCNQGTFDASQSPPTNSLVVLDFGGQLGDGSGTLMINGLDASNAQIEAVAEAFGHGYWYCTGHDLTSKLSLALGTNNSYFDVSWSGGTTWAQNVQAVVAYNQANGYNSQVITDGGNDIEPDWDTTVDSEAWVNGFAATSSTFSVDYGSADGCPTDSSANAPCSNGWTQYDVWYVSWGATSAQALPEIYSSTDAQQWAMLSLYGAEYRGSTGKISFMGPVDTYPSWNTSNTPLQAWQQLWSDLNRTAATAENMPFSAEMHNET